MLFSGWLDPFLLSLMLKWAWTFASYPGHWSCLAVLVGSLTGAYVYVSFPDLVLQIILTILLFILMVESGRKFIETYRKESKAKAAKEAEAAGEKKEENAPDVNIAKIKDEPEHKDNNGEKDGGEKDIVSTHTHRRA